jgi:CubicO group peptidase (beta-lactamase class C family)
MMFIRFSKCGTYLPAVLTLLAAIPFQSQILRAGAQASAALPDGAAGRQLASSLRLYNTGDQAAIPDVQTFKRVNDAIVAKFNQEDYAGIYDMGNAYFKFAEKPESWINAWKELKDNTGEIVSSELIDDFGRVKHFRWTGKKKIRRFELWMEGPNFTALYLSSFIQQSDSSQRSVPTDNPQKTALDSAVQKFATVYMSGPKKVGLSIGVYKDGKSYVYNYGEVEKGSGALPSGNTFFNVGSVAKSFVGILLAQAVLEHKVSLQDDVRKYLQGDYPNLAFDGVPIRLINLANHTSGLPHWIYTQPNGKSANDLPLTEQDQFYNSYSEADFLRDLHKAKVETLPGAKYSYSSSGIGLLNLILEKVYGESRDDLIRRYFGKTIGMYDTRAQMSSQDLRRYAQGYEGDKVMAREVQPWVGLVGTNSTTNDMLKYVKANVEEKDEAILRSHCPTFGDLNNNSAVGLTWAIRNTYDMGRRIDFNGFNPGYITLITVYPDKGLGFVLWANEDDDMSGLFHLERDVVQSLQSQ